MAAVLENMSIEDFPAMITLWKKLPGIGLSKADKKKYLAKFLEKNSRYCFVMKDGKKLVGTILAGNDGRRGYIYHLAIEPDFQSKGFGAKLVQKSLHALSANGIHKAHIFVISDNLTGIDFWEHIGWTLRDDVLIMSKDLIEA
jgi:ribosomal protein S18 acetylase RimI-like enzyme